jgi:peroxiredoxin
MGYPRYFFAKTIIVACGIALAGCFVPPQIDPAKEAPPFKGRSPRDGKAYSLLDSLVDGPTLVVFIPRGCAEVDQALQYFSLIHRAYDGQASVLGVYVDQEEQTKTWLANRPNLKIPVIPDVDHHFIEKYKFQRGPAAVLVAKTGEMVGKWEGWSATAFDEMNAGLAKLLKTSKANIDTKSAPTVTQPGCAYN